jgi:hypothetical protein
VRCIPLFIASQQLGKHVPTATNATTEELLDTCVCILLSLLGKDSPTAMKNGDVIFCVVHVVSKESRQIILPRTSCIIFYFYQEIT